MEPTYLAHTALNVLNSDPALVAVYLSAITSTVVDATRLFVNPRPDRLPTAALSSIAAGLLTAGILKCTEATCPDLVWATMPLGYIFPSFVRGIIKATTGRGADDDLYPMSSLIAGGLITGIINIAAGHSFDLSHSATMEAYRSTMRFFGDAIGSFGRTLPNLAQRVKSIPK